MHKVSKTFAMLLITCLMLGANPAWGGTSIGLVINKSTNQLGFYQSGTLIKTFPVATGRRPKDTPEGEFKVVRKLVNPYYTKGKIPGGSPRNPLGVRWLGLSVGNTGGGTYGIHGNNNPRSIGTYASAGCIRMYNKDVLWLYDRVPINTHVKIGRWKELPKTIVVEEIIPLEVNGQQIPGPNKVYMRNGEGWIVLRDTATALGYQVAWDNQSRAILLRKGVTELLVSPDTDITKRNNISFATPVIIRNGQAYVTHAFIENFFQAKVSFTETKATVIK